MEDQDLPLTGITVVSFEHAIAAPLCTRQLADQGARVIKIERRESGDFARHYDTRAEGQSSHFVWTNRGKESCTLDIKHEDAAPVLDRLLENCDVLVENLAPGALQRCGLGPDALQSRLPRLIYCSISGYGRDGPYAERKAYDLMVQAESGLLSVTGAEQVAKSGISIADIAAGTQAHAAILAALLKRPRSKRGSVIEISMLEALVEWMGYPLYYSYADQIPPARTGADHASIYPYGAFQCKGGDNILFGIQNEREWHSFCTTILKMPELASDARFDENRKRSEQRTLLRDLIEEKLQHWTAEEAGKALDAAEIAWARVNSMHEVWQHPQLRARHRFAEFTTPRGTLEGTIPPVHAELKNLAPIPALGEHTHSLLSELGFSATEIADLQQRKVV